MDTPVWDLDFSYNGITDVKVSCHAGDLGAIAMCNMVGEQPLFYIEDSSDAEDELIFNEAIDAEMTDFPMDEKFLNKMRAKLDMYDKTAKSLATFETILPEDEFDNAFNKPQKQTSLKSVLDYGLQSAIFKSYLGFVTNNNIQIILNDETQTSDYNRTEGVITLNPNLNEMIACQSLLKSMRMAWNHKQGILINPLSFQPEEAILVNRLLQADMDVAVTSFLWDLKLAGDEYAWTKSMAGADYDLCSAYAMEAMTDFRTIKNGTALRATFEKWFLSGRCKNYDRQIIQTMMGGHTDIDIDNVDASRVIAMDVIAGMGNRPEGKNYLAPIVTQIMSDDMFGEVRDRSNANFLWFVTFERRMNEVEQKLQSDVGNDEKTTKQTNNVISMPNHTGRSQDTKILSDDGVASVFFLDHFRAG